MLVPPWSLFALPFTRLELPGWGRVYAALGCERDERWTRAPRRDVRSKLHGYVMRLELSNWSERRSWFLARFYELETQLLVQRLLREREQFLDVGANIGMLSLLAARTVGPHGRVHAIEPNPAVATRLRAHLSDNALENVVVHECGLSDHREELVLRVWADQAGQGTFAPLDEHERSLLTAEHVLPLVRGDELLSNGEALAPALIKIDVEGFECRVLRGLERTLAARRPALVVETIEEQLVRAGASVDELFALLRAHDYRVLRITSRRAGLGRRVVLDELRGPADGLSDNLLGVHRDGVHLERLREDRAFDVRLTRSV